MYRLVQNYPEFVVLALHLFLGYINNMTIYLENHSEDSK